MIFAGRPKSLRGATSCCYLRDRLCTYCVQKTNSVPFFATSKCPIEFYGKFNVRDDRKSAMMATRWQTFPFSHQIEEPKVIKPFSQCFAEFVVEKARGRIINRECLCYVVLCLFALARIFFNTTHRFHKVFHVSHDPSLFY